jgi:amino acid transporter
LIVAVFIFWSAFQCQGLCLAEISGCLPFTGGSYAVVRATLGPWLGFLTGMLEICQSLLSFSFSIWYISEILSSHFGYGNDYKLETCIPFLFILIGLNMLQSYFSKFWLATFVAAVSVVVIWLVFLTGASQQVQFSQYANTGNQSHNIAVLTDSISVGVWFFVCLSAIPTISSSIAMPKRQYPKMFISMTTVSLVVAVITIFISCAQAPGRVALHTQALPLTPAYYRLFRSTFDSPRNAVWLSFPAIVYTAFILLSTTTRRLHSLCASGLLPHITHFLNRIQRCILRFPKRLCCYTSSPESHHSNEDNFEEDFPSTEVRSENRKHYASPHSISSPRSEKPSSPSLLSSLKAFYQPHHDLNSHSNMHSASAVTAPAGASMIMINICVGIMAFLLCTLIRYRGSDSQYYLLMMIVYSTLIVGVFIMLAYLQFRKKFDCLETTFRSPLQSYGAVYGGGIFCVAISYTIAKQRNDVNSIIGIVVYLVALSMYYFYAARRSQCFSEEEQKVMFVAYVINANIKSKLRRQSSMALKRENSVGTLIQRTSSFFGQAPSSTKSAGSHSSFHSFMRTKNENSVSISGRSINGNSGSSTIPRRLLKLPHPLPSSPPTEHNGESSTQQPTSVESITTATGLSASIDHPTSLKAGQVSYSNMQTQDALTLGAADDSTSSIVSGGEGTVLLVIDGCASGAVSPVLTVKGPVSALSQSDLSTAPNSSKKTSFHQPENVNNQQKSSIPPFQSSKALDHNLPVAVEEESVQSSPEISMRQQQIETSISSVPTAVAPPIVQDIQQSMEGFALKQSQLPPCSDNVATQTTIKSFSSSSLNNTNSSGIRNSFIGWMISSISKPRIYTIPDEDEETGVGHNETVNRSRTSSRGSHHSTSQREMKPQLPRLTSQHESDKLLHPTNSAISSNLEQNTAHEGEDEIALKSRKQSNRESFTMPVPSKVYRHSLGEVMILKNSSLQKLLLDSEFENSVQSSRKNSLEATPSGTNARYSSSGSSKKMTVLPFFTISTRQNHYRKSSIVINGSEQDAQEESSKHNAIDSHGNNSNIPLNNSQRSSQKQLPLKRDSLVRGLLRRSIHQLSTIVSQVFPVADDQKEFQEYTEVFVQTMLQDMKLVDDDDDDDDDVLQLGEKLHNNESLHALSEEIDVLDV